MVLVGLLFCIALQGAEQEKLIEQSCDHKVTIHTMQLMNRRAQLQDDPRNLRRTALLISKSVPCFPGVIRDIVIDYVRYSKDPAEEAFQNNIDIALRRYRRVQLCTGIMLVGGLVECTVGLGIGIRENDQADSFALQSPPVNRPLAGVVFGCSVLVALGSECVGIFRLDRLSGLIPSSAIIERSKIARASACGTTAIVIGVLPLTALVGGVFPAIGPVVLMGGGLIGSIATALALAKSCLRAHKLVKLQTVGK